MKIGILGGGLSGIALQRFLNHESEVLEKEDRVGGLCRTFEKNGFKYDIGGHILFSKDQVILDYFKTILGNNINYCKRNNKIFFKDRFMKYPFENDLSALDKDDLYDCLIGYLENNYPDPTNFKEWIYNNFGDGIAQKYLVPYNEKIWKEPLENIALDWVERVPKPPLEDIVKSALGIETEGYQHQLYFVYPNYGGIEGLIMAMRRQDGEVITNFEVKNVRRNNKVWIVSDGTKEFIYDKIVITFPILEAITCFENIPEDVKKAALSLRNNMVRVVMIGVNNESLMDKSAIYFPQNNIIFHRICFMGYFSKYNVPSSCSSLIAEVTTHLNHPLSQVSDDTLIEMVIDDLGKLAIVNRKDIVATDIFNAKYGYIVYDSNHRKNVKMLRSYFDSLGIELHGRFAEFDYINMDEVVHRSMALAAKLNGLGK